MLSPNLQKLTANSTPFFWNDDLQKELDEMKAALMQHIKLTPLDTVSTVTEDIERVNNAITDVNICRIQYNIITFNLYYANLLNKYLHLLIFLLGITFAFDILSVYLREGKIGRSEPQCSHLRRQNMDFTL